MSHLIELILCVLGYITSPHQLSDIVYLSMYFFACNIGTTSELYLPPSVTIISIS